MINYLVKAKWEGVEADPLTNQNGKVKKYTEQYLVEAVSVTDAEAKTVEEFGQGISGFEVKEVKATKIIAAV